mmetsp:Transcript_12210/g.15877  ORF Transcript_12210/g.15877 Transcript_12210/m.15877 type:complete len:82 (-) Transcript_12210:376-621(-)
MKGKFYTSLFMHYAPLEWSGNTEMIEKAKDTFTVERWRNVLPKDPRYPAVLVKGTGWYNPDCENNWCDLVWDMNEELKEEL